MTTLYIIAYILLYIGTYYYCRWLWKLSGLDWTWDVIIKHMFWSLLTIIPVIVVSIIIIPDIIEEKGINSPKWL